MSQLSSKTISLKGAVLSGNHKSGSVEEPLDFIDRSESRNGRPHWLSPTFSYYDAF